MLLGVEAMEGTAVQTLKRLLGLSLDLDAVVPAEPVKVQGNKAPVGMVVMKESSEGSLKGIWAFNEFLYLLSSLLCTATISTPTTNGVWTVTLGTQSSGHFHLIFNGQTTDEIAYNAAASAVQSALVALSTVGSGNVTVTGAAGGPFTVTFRAGLIGTTLALTADFSTLTTPGNASIATTAATNTRRWRFLPEQSDPDTVESYTVATGTTREAGRAAGHKFTDFGLTVAEKGADVTGKTLGRRLAEGYRVQNVYLSGAPTGGTFTLTYAGQETGNIAYNASGAEVEAALELLSTVLAGNVSVIGTRAYTLDLDTPTSGTFDLTFNGVSATGIAYNVSASTLQTTLAALSTIGTGNVTVSGGPGNTTPFTITFTGDLIHTDLALTADFGSLVGGAGAAITANLGGPWSVEFIEDLAETTITVLSADGTSLTGGTSPAANIGYCTAGLTLTEVAHVPVPPKKVSVYVGASLLGLTKLEDCLQWKWDFKPRHRGVMTLDEADPSLSSTLELAGDPTMQLIVEQNSVADAFMDDLRSGTTKYIRIVANGSSIETGYKYRIILTAPFAFLNPKRGPHEDVQAGTYDLQLLYHSAVGSYMEVIVETALTAL
ncbi:MAG: hypothetical protein A2W00_04485 [Candidatus Eisenbacteria bacterium RBG_16_71_46]|nr:MAG: hypothetical protein A2W00_04485 [Candidatus Eisenbacteria bacterium RBG_16_71_46]